MLKGVLYFTFIISIILFFQGHIIVLILLPLYIFLAIVMFLFKKINKILK